MKYPYSTELDQSYFEFRPVILSKNLNSIRVFFLTNVPDVVVDLVSLLLGIFERLGLFFGIGVPNLFGSLSQYPGIHRTLFQLYKLGLVKHAYIERKEYDDEPSFYGVIVRVEGRQRMGYSGYGKSLFSPEKAAWPAIGEAVERWSLEHYTPDSRQCRYIDVKTLREEYRVDLLSSAGFSKTTRQQVGRERSYELTDNSVLYCCPVDSVGDNTTVMAPLQWFSFKHAARFTDTKKEPVISPIVSTGAAVSNNFRGAVYRGMLEVIERDAVMIYWHNQLTPRRINYRQRGTPVCQAIAQLVDRYKLRIEIVYLQTDFATHTVQAFVLDDTGIGPAVLCDSASGLDLDTCIERSVLGAIGVRAYVRTKKNEKQHSDLRLSELTMENRSLWWSSPEKSELLNHYLSGSYMEDSQFECLVNFDENTHYEALVQYLNERSYTVLAKNITPDTVTNKTGLVAVMVKIPDLVPMHFNEWERCDNGNRLTEVPVRLGLSMSTTTNQLPHPYV